MVSLISSFVIDISIIEFNKLKIIIPINSKTIIEIIKHTEPINSIQYLNLVK